MDNLLINTRNEINSIILDDLVGDCSIPARDWDSIITIFNADSRNKLFSIPGIICSKLIQEIKDGAIPKLIFREYGLNFQSFLNTYNKIKSEIEEISLLENIREEHIDYLNNCKINPTFILGKDIERATAFHFNDSLKSLRKISMLNPQAFKDYMKIVHAEEFTEKEKDNNLEVVIKIQPGLINEI